MKMILFFNLIGHVYSQQVLKQNECYNCGQLKSQTDCESFKRVSCEWIGANGIVSAKCQKKAEETEQGTFKSHCELIEEPQINCSIAQIHLVVLTQIKNAYILQDLRLMLKQVHKNAKKSYRCVSDGCSCLGINLQGLHQNSM